MSFRLHERLAADCHRLRALGTSELLLHRNAAVPWFLLVPRVDVLELCDLDRATRAALHDEIDAVCALLRAHFEVTKLNVAAIGNLVPQLHVHVVGRHAGDPCWPQPVWGHLRETRAWAPEALARIEAAAAAIGREPG